MKYILSFLITLLPITSFCQEHVCYGDHQKVYASSSETVRVFIDKEGDYYPEAWLDNDLLREAEGSLRDMYKLTPSVFSQVSKLYGYEFSEYSDDHFFQLQKSVVSQKLEEIHSFIQPRSELFILIHGFRKPVVNNHGGTSSKEDYELMRRNIANSSVSNKDKFIEVYWDGMYIEGKRSLKSAKAMGKLFRDEAQPNAESTGKGLRQLVKEINHDKITVICHSLGAKLGVNLFLKDNLSLPLNKSQSRTKLCLVAAAISKKELKQLYKRRKEIEILSDEALQLYVMYNEDDFVLSKSFRMLGMTIKFSRLYGNTRLGCNCSRDAKELKKKSEKENSAVAVELINITSIGASHHARDYFSSEEFKAFISEIK